MEPYGFIDADDIRYHKTVKAVKKSLLHKGLMYRYNTHDDFGCPSSAFTICTFWLIRALYVIGEKDEARCLFDEILQYSNHLGLFSEDIDFETKEQLGNFPQAYSHSGFGLGFERLLLFVTGMTNIRDVIPFPRTPRNAEF